MRVRTSIRALLAFALVQPGLSLAERVPAATVSVTGGDGSSIGKSVIVVGARTAEEVASAELGWLAEHLPSATIESRGRITGPPHYDVITVRLANGATMDLHFDITAFQDN